jgi:stage IV sporulation protein FB
LETEEYTYYPSKPELIEANSASIPKLILSMVAFIGIFYLLGLDMNLIFLIVLVLFLHEMGHLIAMKSFGYKDVGMMFIPLVGAVVTGRKDNLNQLEKVIVVLAGPIPGIVLGIGLIEAYELGWAEERYMIMGALFILLNAMNLLPIDPLDGGKFIESLLFSVNQAFKNIFSYLSAALVLYIATYQLLYKGMTMEFFIFAVIGYFMISRIRSGWQLNKLQKQLSELSIDLNKDFDDLTDREYWLIRKHFIQSSRLGKLVDADSKEYDEREEAIAPAIKGVLFPKVTNNINALGKISFLLVWAAAVAMSTWYLYPFVRDFIENYQHV